MFAFIPELINSICGWADGNYGTAKCMSRAPSAPGDSKSVISNRIVKRTYVLGQFQSTGVRASSRCNFEGDPGDDVLANLEICFGFEPGWIGGRLEVDLERFVLLGNKTLEEFWSRFGAETGSLGNK